MGKATPSAVVTTALRLRDALRNAMLTVAGLGVALAALAQPDAAIAPGRAAPAAAGGSVVDRLQQGSPIRLGHRDAAMPFSYLVGEQPTGYTVDLCLMLVEGLRKRLNLGKIEVEWVRLQAAARLPAVLSGRIDLECGNTTANAERRKSVAFTVPTFIAGAGVLTNSRLNASSLADLKGKRIAVAAGTTGQKIVQHANASEYDLKPVVVKDNAQAFEVLESGQADAWVTDDVLLAAYRAQAPDPTRYRLLDRRHTIEPLAIMLRKDDPAFEAAVHAELVGLIRAGRVQVLYEKWFMQPVPPRGMSLDLPPSNLLRETFRHPMRLRHDIDIIVL